MTLINTAKKYWYIIASIVTVVTLASFIVTIVQTPEYKSSVQLLVIQKQEENADAYTATRSAETVANILSNVIYTSTFFDQVMSSGFEVNRDSFSSDLEERKKEWKDAVDARVVGDTGTLQIDVYDPNRNQAEQLAYAIAYVMINNGKQYHGAAGQIEIKLIDAPITTDNIARPNIALNIAGGFVLGILTSLAIIFLLSERKPKEKFVADLEVRTMPEVKEKKKSLFTKNKSKKGDKLSKETKMAEFPGSKVKDRIASELKEFQKTSEDKPKLEEKQKPEKKEKEQPDFEKETSEKEVKNRIAKGMGSLGAAAKEEPVSTGEDIIYSAEDIQENYKSAEEDKYSPEKVEKWIKTGKFD